jgi:hypothetical protein
MREDIDGITLLLAILRIDVQAVAEAPIERRIADRFKFLDKFSAA